MVYRHIPAHDRLLKTLFVLRMCCCNRYHGNAVKGFRALWDNIYGLAFTAVNFPAILDRQFDSYNHKTDEVKKCGTWDRLNKRNSDKIFVWTREGKEQIGIPRNRYDVDWINLSQDRVNWSKLWEHKMRETSCLAELLSDVKSILLHVVRWELLRSKREKRLQSMTVVFEFSDVATVISCDDELQSSRKDFDGSV
jgi:hypothetical protein